MKKITIIVVLLFAALTAVAQENPKHGSRSKWGEEMLQAKHEMIIEQVGLTPTQREQFMPLYEEMEKEIFSTNAAARALAIVVSKKANPSEADYGQAAEALSGAKVKEGEIEAKYFEKFSKILSKKQLFLLKQAESNFTRTMLSGRKGKGDRPKGDRPKGDRPKAKRQ